MPLVQLYDLCDVYQNLVFIASMKTGVRYSNQVGGTYCDHPELEGALVPLPFSIMERGDPLYDKHEEGHDMVLVEKFLKAHDLEKYFTTRGVAREAAFLTAEAWVPVRVLKTTHEVLKDFEGVSGVLTYQNSD